MSIVDPADAEPVRDVARPRRSGPLPPSPLLEPGMPRTTRSCSTASAAGLTEQFIAAVRGTPGWSSSGCAPVRLVRPGAGDREGTVHPVRVRLQARGVRPTRCTHRRGRRRRRRRGSPGRAISMACAQAFADLAITGTRTARSSSTRPGKDSRRGACPMTVDRRTSTPARWPWSPVPAAGIGAAITRRFVAEGGRVVGGDINETRSTRCAAELGERVRRACAATSPSRPTWRRWSPPRSTRSVRLRRRRSTWPARRAGADRRHDRGGVGLHRRPLPEGRVLRR